MNIHLIRESSFNLESFTNVVQTLQQYPGPVKYISHEEPVTYNDDELINEIWDKERLFTIVNCYSERLVELSRVSNIKWENIFGHCQDARHKNHLPDNEPVVLLTHYANEYNWFQGADPSGRLNLFVQTSMWNYYVNGEIIYPVIHQLATIPLKVLMYKDFNERVEKAHQTPRGCINDFCKNKMEITLKLRTADICPECREIILKKKIDPLITSQTFTILEAMRKQFIYYSSLTEDSEPARLEVNYRERTFILPQLGIKLPFGPMESTVYHLYLNHPEGIAYAALPDEHRHELYRLYSNYSDVGAIGTIQARVNKICTDRDSMSNVISRIRRKIEETLPQSIAKYYVISGENGMRQKIRLNKAFITMN
ncbi:MAG: hypothetical protein WCQ70_08655 [Lentimicrobiaceae bacterium]